MTVESSKITKKKSVAGRENRRGENYGQLNVYPLLICAIGNVRPRVFSF